MKWKIYCYSNKNTKEAVAETIFSCYAIQEEADKKKCVNSTSCCEALGDKRGQ